MKNIVICSDGTGNTANKGRGTNVFKLFEAVELKDPSISQVAIYDDGVGTEESKVLKVLGGAFGVGLARNVRQLYTELVKVYEPDDQIYLFGFSRGAFTVRVLAGFIEACGILQDKYTHYDELKKTVRIGYRNYRRKFRRFHGTRKRSREMQEGLMRMMKSDKKASAAGYQQALEAHVERAVSRCEQWRKAQGAHEPPPIRFIGVWDTVAAVGLPIDEAADFLNEIFAFKMQDRRLGERVVQGCHALAIDDERRTFHPLMWDEREEPDSGRIKQVWFAGAHSNVGGGYPRQGMSLVTLDWMMEEAEKAGLTFKPSARDEYRAAHNVHDKLYNSRAGIAVYYRYKPRNIVEICKESKTAPQIHDSVLERIKFGTSGYAPGNVPGNFDLVETGEAREKNKEKNKLQLAFGDDVSSMLDNVKGSIFVRRFAHYGFFLSTVLLFLGYITFGSEGTLSERFKSLTTLNLNGFLDAIFTWDFGLVLVLLIGAFYLTSGVVRRKLKKSFSTGWRKAEAALWP